MGQIVKRKKKGRPPKSDLAKRSPKSAPPQTPEPDLRRSLRRRSVRYNFIDYDDYIDDDYDFYDDRAGGGGGGEEEGDDEEEDEDERRRGKKLKLVVKLDQKARGEHARDSGASGSDEEESEKRAVKKRRISGGRSGDEDAEELERGGDDAEDDDEELRGLRGNTTELNSPTARSSTPLSSSGIPLPDKRTLELILDKLQKKDIYGVYAEPVDPEELPDYHDIIEHPMDFSTVRKKLANGSYSTLEQFESDVFLICSNAMQYNAPDTIYHKQARSIQELGRKKFLKLTIAFERLEKENKAEDKVKMDLEQSERELKSEHRAKPSFLVKKQMKKQFSRPLQEPVCSDSAGLTCGDVGDVPNCSAANHAVGYDVPSNVEGLTESNASQVENNIDKAEDFSLGKTLPSKFGRKPYVIDENRRATYNITEQPVVESETIFSTFEGEVRQLVAVGLTVEYSYARSLARFAATLGPAAWKLASQKIERALPAGCKFGRGWVGEYEPQPTSVFTFRNHTKKDYPLVARLPYKDGLRKNDVISKTSVPVKEHTVTRPSLEGKPFSSSNGKPPVHAGRRSNTTNNVNYQMQSPRSRISSEPKSKVVEQLELNSLPSGCQNNVEHAPEKNLPKNTEAAGFRSVESVLRNHNTEASVAASSGREQVVRDISQLQPLPSEQPDATGVISGGLSNGKVSITCLENGGTNPTSTSSAIPNQIPRIISNSYGQDQGLSDPVQLMRMLAEKAQWQHNSSNHSVIDATSVVTPTPSSKRDDPGNAAAAAARAWMSVGAGGLKQAMENSRVHNSQLPANFPYNPSYEFLSHMARIQGELPASVIMQFQSQKNSLPGQMSGRPPFQGGTEVQYQNRPVVFPQFIAANMARFQPQSPWRGVSTHALPRQKQETRPPDLNIGFQPPGSPVPQSSGVMVDTQQPDLALQL